MHRQVYDWFPDRTFEGVLIVGAGADRMALALRREPVTLTR